MEADRIGKRNWELAAVEGMVVVVIIGMLIAIAVPQYRQLAEKRIVSRAEETCRLIWRAEMEYVRRFNRFKELKGAAEIMAPMPDGLGIRLDVSLPFYFAAVESSVVALGTGRMMGTNITYAPGRRPEWSVQRK